jgi:ornithine cyclodeaminase
MVTYAGMSEIGRLVRSVGVEPLLSRMASYIREDFLRWESFEKSARLASHSRFGVIELMPISDGALFAFKYVNGHPANTASGKLTVTAMGVLADVATGYPLLLSELTICTALRTAATSALAASVMARKDAQTMAIIGNGAQSEFQVLAFKALLGIRKVRAFDLDPAATERLIRNLSGVSGLEIVRAASIREAVRGADIVTTATADKSRAAILTADAVEPGMHINAVGGDCPGKTELHPEVLRMARVVVEFEPQTRIEGDIQQLEADFPVAELWRVLSGEAPGRMSQDEVTVFDSVGFALEDFSTLRLIRDLCGGIPKAGTIDLMPPENIDPKDLFGLVCAPARPNFGIFSSSARRNSSSLSG